MFPFYLSATMKSSDEVGDDKFICFRPGLKSVEDMGCEVM